MTNKFNEDTAELISCMVKTFQDKKLGKRISGRITRGRASASSNDFEEGLARLIEKNTPDDIKILVDYPISYRLPTVQRAKTIYPDIALVRDTSLLAILEAKIDLGYISADWAQGRKTIVEQLKSVDYISIGSQQFRVSSDLRVATVVLSARNDHGRLTAFVSEVENSIVLLSREYRHPNDEMRVGERDIYLAEIRSNEENLHQWKELERFCTNYS